MIKPLFTEKRRSAITDYSSGALSPSEVESKARLRDGNHIVVDQEGRVYNTHPLTDLYAEETGGYVYPIRWQLSQWDLTEEIVEKLRLDFDVDTRS